VNLGTVTHSGDTVNVTGSATGEDAVFRYAKDLRASGRFTLVVITRIDGDGNFTLRLTK
jgi:hypothetical protein